MSRRDVIETVGNDLTIETLAGPFVLLREHAVFWPDRRLLFVADMHVGKDTAFRSAGIPLPPGTLAADLSRLAGAITRHDPERVYILGDLLHARDGMSDEMFDDFGRWRQQLSVPMTLVPGNHDRSLERIPPSWLLDLGDPIVELGTVRLTHNPVTTRGKFTWGGHIHPTARAGRGVGAVSAPCFIIAHSLGILPAFTSFAAGVRLELEDAARCYGVLGHRHVIPFDER